MKPFIENIDVNNSSLTETQRARAVNIKRLIDGVPTKINA
jgi:hypothetical protein